MRGAALDYIEVGDDYAIVKTSPNSAVLGRRLGDTRIRQEHGVTVMAVRRGGAPWCNADADTVLQEGDTILVAGPTRRAEEFGQLR